MPKEKVKDPVAEFVVKEFERYENFHNERFDAWKEMEKDWNNKAPRRDYDWQNAVHVPLIIEAEQTITPRLFTALFPTDAPIDVHVEGDTPPEQGIKIKGLLEHYFRVTNVQREAHSMLVQNTLFGTGYVEGGSWLTESGWVIDEVTGERYKAIINSRPDCIHVDSFEIFPHPAKLRMDDSLPLVRRRYCDAEFLKNLAEDDHQFKNLSKALQTEAPFSKGKYYNKKRRDEYEILEYWGPWDESYENEGKVAVRKAVPYWIIVINRKIVVRSIPNPYNHQSPPFCKTILFPAPRPSWFGAGIGEIGKPTQDRLNKIVNQRLDNVDLVLNKQGCYNGNDHLINTKKLQVSKPGQWHKTSDTVTSLRWMETPDVTASSYKEEELAKQDFREATGATANLMPTDPKDQHRTAMGINLLQGAAGMRFRPVLRRLEIDFIQRLAMLYFSNLKQFMTDAEWVLITGKGGEQEPVMIKPEEIQAKIFFVPTGISEVMNKETQVGQLLRFKEVTMNDPTINRQEINKRIAELMGFKDIHKLLVPQQQMQQGPQGMPPEMQQQIQQRVAEGASPEQIKMELLGPKPKPQLQGAQR